MAMLEPTEAGSTFYGAGGQYIKSMPALPIQQEQSTDVFSILDQQYQQTLKSNEMQFGQMQEEMLRKTRYELQKLSEKYQTERSYIERLKVPADQKRQKLLQLNNKYELAAITARSKVKPDTDALNTQRQQQGTALQQAYQQKQRDLQLIQQLVDDGTIQDPDAARQKQYAMVGMSLPISAFREPKQLSMEEIAEQQVGIQFQITNLEQAAETATGDERAAIMSKIDELQEQRIELMGVQMPEYKGIAEKSDKLSKVGRKMAAGRKPGTLAEGVWQKKQKKLRSTVLKLKMLGLPGFALGSLIEPKVKKLEEEYEKRQKKTSVSTPAELRAKGTKEAFEEGKKLGYWN